MSNTPCGASPPTLTFSHRSGVTPYTSSCELAGSCVFGKQLPERLSLRPMHRAKARCGAKNQEAGAKRKFIFPGSWLKAHNSASHLGAMHGQALSLTYGRFFAEFLRGKSLVPLGLLALSTCVGLRYGDLTLVFPDFSRKALHKR